MAAVAGQGGKERLDARLEVAPGGLDGGVGLIGVHDGETDEAPRKIRSAARARIRVLAGGAQYVPGSRVMGKHDNQVMFSRLRQLVRAHPVLTFYALAFPLSWRAYALALFRPGGALGLDPYGPLVAAVAVTALGGGLKAWARSLLRWRAAASLYAFALLSPLIITLLGIGANVALGATPPPASTWAAWPTVLLAFPLVMVLGGPLGEEPAWRGLALARVAVRRSMLEASLAVGVVWFAWHLPLLLARPGELAPGLVGILSASVVFGWLYRRSDGVVLLPLLMHTAQNTFGGEFAGPMFGGADVTRLSWLRGGLYLVTALVLVLRDPRLRMAPVAPATDDVAEQRVAA